MRVHECGLILKTKSTVLAWCPSCLGHLAGLQTGGDGLWAGSIFPICCHPLGARVPGCREALHSSELTPVLLQAHEQSREVSVFPLLLFAWSFLGEKGSLIFALEQAAFLQYCLPHLCKIISREIKALWTLRSFHFTWHLKNKNRILQRIHKNTLHQREDCGTIEQPQYCKCSSCSVAD